MKSIVARHQTLQPPTLTTMNIEYRERISSLCGTVNLSTEFERRAHGPGARNRPGSCGTFVSGSSLGLYRIILSVPFPLYVISSLTYSAYYFSGFVNTLWEAEKIRKKGLAISIKKEFLFNSCSQTLLTGLIYKIFQLLNKAGRCVLAL